MTLHWLPVDILVYFVTTGYEGGVAQRSEDDGLLVARRAVPWPGDPSKIDVRALKSMTVRPNQTALVQNHRPVVCAFCA